ncbi:MAG: FHIPEP family type III secretion protein [Myxococcaceae bacterium]
MRLKTFLGPDVVVALVVTLVVAAMVVPLPAWLLDFGLATSLAAGVALLIAALYAKDALAVTAFPTLLLVTTLGRLSLNISSTRLALSEGHAGKLIEAFGEFVVRGDYVVGAVVFVILCVVQFVVVAKGSERVAEVSARFSLDAMPGKQMSIDADLRAGSIDAAVAALRRRNLERESQMFGAMDGAMKFVKGDVIAGLLIVLVNLVAGTGVGVASGGMSFQEAAANYALIAIGDGLVSQIPSLCVAVAAGLVVTRVSPAEVGASLGGEIGSQFLQNPKTLVVVSMGCLALACLPGMPRWAFGTLGVAALAWAGALWRRGGENGQRTGTTPTKAPGSALTTFEGTPRLSLELSGPWVSSEARVQVTQSISDSLDRAQRALRLELGLPLTGIHVTCAPDRKAGYRVLLDGVPVGEGDFEPGRIAVSAPLEELTALGIAGEAAKDPSTGSPITFLRVGDEKRLGRTLWSARASEDLLAEAVMARLKPYAAQLLGVQEVRSLLDGLEATAPVLIQEALKKVPLPLITEVLGRLLAEQVSIHNLRLILEALVAPATEGDAAALAERCRVALCRQLSHQFAPQGALFAYLVDPALEEMLRTGFADPVQVDGLLARVRAISGDGNAVLLAAPDIRRTLRKLCEIAFPKVAVLTYGELDAQLQVRPLGKLALA